MNIFLHELKANRKSIIIWAFSMAALASMYIFIFKSLGNDINAFRDYVRSLPEVMKKAFGLNPEILSTLEGFYSFVFPFIVLCGAIQAMNLGTSIVSKEIREKTADFLMTKPVSRERILSAKLLAALSSLVITNIIYLVLVVSIAATVARNFNLKLLLMISFTLFFVQLMFMVLGIIISVVIGKIRSVIPISLGTVFGFYIIGTLGSVFGEEKVRYLSPFRYFDTAYIIKNAAYETSFVTVGLIFVIAAAAGSYFVYMKKDIHAV